MSGIRSEEHFLDMIDEFFPETGPHVRLGRGDDAAVLACPGRMCLSTDLFLEDEHFRRGYFEPEDVGYKALAVNLSDMAAMGARPLGFSLGLSAPADVEESWWRRMLSGMAELSRRFACPLTGGDVARASKIGLCVSIWGEAADTERERFLTRGSGAAGDIVAIALPEEGSLGLARAGLLLLELAHASRDPAAVERTKIRFPKCTAAHLRPEPLVDLGLVLGRRSAVTSCMDLSDGLARDLPHLLPPYAGAELDLSEKSMPQELRAACAELGLDPLETALLGGEEYGLLLTVRDMKALRDVPGLTELGRVASQPGLRVNGRAWELQGFDHFRA